MAKPEPEPENTKLNREQKPADFIKTRAALAKAQSAAKTKLPQVTTHRGARNTNPNLN